MTIIKRKCEERAIRRDLQQSIDRCSPTLNSLITVLCTKPPFSTEFPAKSRQIVAEMMESLTAAALIGWQQGSQGKPSLVTTTGPEAWALLTKCAHARGFAIGQLRRDAVAHLESELGSKQS
jgi:hypothetical protein